MDYALQIYVDVSKIKNIDLHCQGFGKVRVGDLAPSFDSRCGFIGRISIRLSLCHLRRPESPRQSLENDATALFDREVAPATLQTFAPNSSSKICLCQVRSIRKVPSDFLLQPIKNLRFSELSVLLRSVRVKFFCTSSRDLLATDFLLGLS